MIYKTPIFKYFLFIRYVINLNEIILVLFEDVYVIEKDEEMGAISQALNEKNGKLKGGLIFLLYKLQMYDVSTSEFDFYYASSIFSVVAFLLYKIYIEAYEIWLWILDEFYEYLDIRMRNSVEREKETKKISAPITINQVALQRTDAVQPTAPHITEANEPPVQLPSIVTEHSSRNNQETTSNQCVARYSKRRKYSKYSK
jgi:hypothetical protein